MTLNELDAQIDIEITSEQIRTNEEIIISTPQGRIAYTLNPQIQLNKVYRFKGKGHRRIGYNVADEVGDFYIQFMLKNTTTNEEREKEPESLNLYCFYSPMGDKGDKYAIPSFISMFSKYLEHSSNGYYGRDAYMILEAVEDILVITIQYTHQAFSDKREYCYKFYMDFTPDNQMHYAEACYFPDKFNQGERFTMREEDVAHLFNCMSVAMWNQEMRDKGYYARFDIENDNSIITLNEKHCTITDYIAEAFNAKTYLEPFTCSKENLLPNYIRELAVSMKSN